MSTTEQLLARAGHKTLHIDQKMPLETDCFTAVMWNELVRFVNI
jgi:hypothetical protein